MELDSGSAGSASCSSTESSLSGLKFDKEIYFDDVGTSGAPVRGTGAGLERKVASGQTPRCQVEGCKVDLSDAKTYHSKHKVCGMHSKSPVVNVAGLEQRFCQQCSRFHLLPEFDQAKRSCRRRLAGHNERRRKPSPRSLLGTRFGWLSSSVIENSSQGGGFLVDFSAYQMVGGRDGWPVTRHLSQPLWQNHSQDPLPDCYIRCSTGGTGFSSPGIHCGECFTVVADSNCALSLLSNQPWGSRNQASGLGVVDLMHAHNKSAAQPVSLVDQYPNMSCGFKGNEAGSSSHQMPPQLGLGSTSMPINSQFSGDYNDPTRQTHWSL